MENKLSIVQEETLCEKVCQYPIIFGTSRKGYKEKEVEETHGKKLLLLLIFYQLVSPVKHHSI